MKPATHTCPACGHENRETAKFCEDHAQRACYAALALRDAAG